MIGEGAQTTLSGALAPLQNLGRAQGFGKSGLEGKIALAVARVLRKERVLGRELGIFDDDCIVHARAGDEELFRDFSDYTDSLKGYVIIPVEEYSKLGGV